jgi:lipopolysaccharide biosynthesis glycosyltransferase
MIGGFGKEANFRLFLPLLLPNVSKILYLDCDILCLGDISTLYNIDVSNSPYAAKSEKNFFTLATNPYSKNTFPTLEFFWTLGYDLFDIDYTNAGVMLVNNDYWRQHNYVQRSLEFFAKHKQNKNFRFPDQDILNYLAFQDGSDSRVLFDGKYNILVSIFPYVFGLNSGIDELSELDSTDFRCNFLMKLLSIDNFDKSFQPVIVHYAGPKPWNGQAAIYNKVYQEYSLKIGWDIRLCNAKKIAKYNITKSNIKKTIKYMLPYGVVRYLQKRK